MPLNFRIRDKALYVNLLRQTDVEIPHWKTTPQAAREARITEQMYYRWWKEFGGRKLDQAK